LCKSLLNSFIKTRHRLRAFQVPPLCSVGFAEKLQEVFPWVPVLLNVQPGDHGFEALSDKREEWVQDGVRFMSQHWL